MKHGIFSVKVDGKLLQGKGEFTHNFGNDKNSPIMGTDGKLAGVSGEPQAPYIKGAITVDDDLDIKAFTSISGAVFTLSYGNGGPTLVLSNATYSADGETKTTEGELQCEFFGASLDQI